MLRYTFLFLLVYLGMLLAEPVMPEMFGQKNWLLGLTPVLLTYLGLRAGSLSLMLFILLGGLLHDLILMHYFGMGPLLWGLTVFLVRSQQPWIEGANWLMSVVICFAASFLYLCCDRIFFLLVQQYWSWDFELSLGILRLSGFNAAISVLVFFFFDLVLGRRSKQEAWGS